MCPSLAHIQAVHLKRNRLEPFWGFKKISETKKRKYNSIIVSVQFPGYSLGHPNFFDAENSRKLYFNTKFKHLRDKLPIY